MSNCPFCGRPTIGRARICESTECAKRQQDSWFDGQISVPDGFLTAADFAKERGISRQMVTRNCTNGKYPGAFQDPQSGRWYIPDDAASSGKVGRPPVLDRRKARQPIKATDAEWKGIVEKAAVTGLPVNEYMIRKALDKPINKKK
ncbi:plasmid mobilization protein [Acetonema longum]|uniref:Uncharacterized protein n=1 Tax=Acetonema longum DSM 6540 TaxID=1009370 RepID=F7NK83_9FIRM|nr:hypothetical protein [Acetonema longum]EGO63524.1 hypothetical protein ALO_12481 [Acetonema longum DSM 6540]